MIKHNACPNCAGDVVGRKDKKWCSEQCRSAARDKRSYNVAYYHANKARLTEANKTWREQNRAYVIQKRREWVSKNIDSVREYQLQYQREWYPANRDRQSEYQSRRRDQKAAAGRYEVSKRDYVKLLRRFDGLCAYCASSAAEWDHVVPISRGGRHSIGNIVPSCMPCNRSKGAKLLYQWRLMRVTPDGFDLGSLVIL